MLLKNEEFNYLNFLPNIIRVSKS